MEPPQTAVTTIITAAVAAKNTDATDVVAAVSKNGTTATATANTATSGTTIKRRRSARAHAYRVVAYSTVSFSLVAILAVCVTMPIVYNFVEHIHRQTRRELEFCKVSGELCDDMQIMTCEEIRWESYIFERKKAFDLPASIIKTGRIQCKFLGIGSEPNTARLYYK